MYIVQNGQKSRVRLVTHKEVGGIYRHYIDDSRVTSILVRPKREGGMEYVETDEHVDLDMFRPMEKDQAIAMMDTLQVDSTLRSLILNDIE